MDSSEEAQCPYLKLWFTATPRSWAERPYFSARAFRSRTYLTTWRPEPGGESFDVVLTADQNIEFQQNLSKLPVAVIVVIAKTNRIESLEPLVPELLAILEALQPKTLRRVGV